MSKHYIGDGIEAIDIIKSYKLNFCLGNVVKYVIRAGRKEGESKLEALKKAQHYVQLLKSPTPEPPLLESIALAWPELGPTELAAIGLACMGEAEALESIIAELLNKTERGS